MLALLFEIKKKSFDLQRHEFRRGSDRGPRTPNLSVNFSYMFTFTLAFGFIEINPFSTVLFKTLNFIADFHEK